ncbi:unnamed protein product [Rhizoctonia solani]|uniref:BAG domain-containing protein n=1 Tax=Rhizoctonia solani TaxID=456999 RepID=A0A8H3D0Q8_9AGAM|nr:unnamed protein product [Rhizoctonia solani]
MLCTTASRLVKNEPRKDRQEEEIKHSDGQLTPSHVLNATPTSVPISTPISAVAPFAAAEPEPEPELEEPQVDAAPSYAAIQSIISSLANLQSEFTFPTHLDFLPGPLLKLAYTPNNAPLHGHEHALTGLLTQLDAVESYGDDVVRKARKARKKAVGPIEKELERLDGMKSEAWKQSTKLEPEDSGEEDEEMEDASDKLPTIDQPSQEPVAPVDSTATDQTEHTALSDVRRAASVEQAIGTDPAPIPILEAESTELEEVKKGGDLEIMGDWDQDL